MKRQCGGPATPGAPGSGTRRPASPHHWGSPGCLHRVQPALQEAQSETGIEMEQRSAEGGHRDVSRAAGPGGAPDVLLSQLYWVPTSGAAHTQGGRSAPTQCSAGSAGSSPGVAVPAAAGTGGRGMAVRARRLWESTGGMSVSDSTLSVSAVSSQSREMVGCWAGMRLGDRVTASPSALLARLLLGPASASVSLMITSWSGRLG